ncbi:MAG: 1-deoxy-D-xylulose-5-phosphate synthase [Tenuifilum sp.]|jgi:1-deoxy-D-xylulose-5-phosphate synthase|uniref:1-deoxy-D-xylulose-5-phosphate synthase n=1 Tax=Tenuifilum sp. TaxID=2760880 RepID=UPI0024ABB33A|nr:1-deoxy-D-xylulose-5-phosphate synthase [Tenuifilum sp.]MDI3526357.1 1-deoxy-D-xylulose-5-phosphate synthase [Tenuifilum sp.]
MESQYKLLSQIDSPDDVKKLSLEQLVELSAELRQFIIDVVSENPGHFASSLGVVELTVALHYVYNTPYDRIVWDVGHQAYGHKILTGRRDVFHTNRKYKGISGFPKRAESPYDAFGVGHSSTSISAALGMSVASKLKLENRNIVAVIGDGALTGGMAFEALNHGGSINPNMLVILNDNNISIDPSVGALKEYLLDITTSKTYNKLKDEVWDILGRIDRLAPKTRSVIQKIENAVKSALLKQSNLFESMGFRYFGPVDGHDVVYLAKILKDLKDIPGPKLLHIVTVKGKGYSPAENNQTVFHAPGLFDKETGERIKDSSGKPTPPKYQDVFGETLVELAEKNPKIVGITPAMATGCSLNIMMKKMPDRAFDVGIAEQHAVTFSAGLAAEGLIPFCNIYSTFMQRAYDQVIHDVALQNLPVVFCLDRGGLVGDDGATHHGAYDLAYMRSVPNMTVSAPMNEEELRNLMYTAQLEPKGPISIRYPRGIGVMVDWRKPFQKVEIGKGRVLRTGSDIAILTIGHVGNLASVAADRLEADGVGVFHADMRFVKPLDEELLSRVGKEFKTVITVEDGCLPGGFGSAVLEWFNDNGYNVKVVRLGIPDVFVEHGTQKELYAECGFDIDNIYKTAMKYANSKAKLKVG